MSDTHDHDVVVQALSQHLIDHFEVGQTTLTATTRLEDLGFSSLEVIEILVSFQEATFAVLGRADEIVSLPAEAPPLETIGDVARLVLSAGWLRHEDVPHLDSPAAL